MLLALEFLCVKTRSTSWARLQTSDWRGTPFATSFWVVRLERYTPSWELSQSACRKESEKLDSWAEPKGFLISQGLFREGVLSVFYKRNQISMLQKWKFGYRFQKRPLARQVKYPFLEKLSKLRSTNGQSALATAYFHSASVSYALMHVLLHDAA